MSSTQEVIILAKLAGTRQFLAENQRLIAGQYQLAEATKMAGLAMDTTTKRGWLFNQMIFTARRYLYYGTLAVTGFGVAALKMGMDFNNAMQTARVALDPFFATTNDLNMALNRLWYIAKYTPFQIRDMTLAFRALYPSLRVLGISSDETIDTIAALIDALSVAGRVTGPALQRATIALQHMAFQGRLTGITVNQLARDGIPMFAILHKTLGLNADQMKRIGDLGIPASVAMKAIVQYMQQTPGYANAALRQSQMTLTGLWSTFKDNLSRMMGMLEKDAFGRMQSRIVALDQWFNRFFDHFSGEAVSMRQVLIYAFGAGAGVFWDQLSAVLKLLWSIFTNLARTIVTSKPIWMTLFLALVLIHGILIPINALVQHFGWLLWILIPVLIVWKTVTIAVNTQLAWEAFWTTTNTRLVKNATMMQILFNKELFVYRAVLWLVNTAQKALAISTAFMTVLFTGSARNANGAFRAMTALEKIALRLRYAFFALMAGDVAGSLANLRIAFALIRVQAVLLARTLYTTLIPAFIRTGIAAAAAWIAALGPIAWIVAAAIVLTGILIVLYIRWRWFHNAVNALLRFMWEHPILLLFIPFLGWIVFAVRMLWYFKDQFVSAWNWIEKQAINTWDHIRSGLRWLWRAVMWFVNGIKELFGSLSGVLTHPFQYMFRVVRRVLNWIGDKLGWLGDKLGSVLSRIPGANFVGKYVLGLAGGGTLRQPGWTMVGERGPELLMLPGGSSVLPLPPTTKNAKQFFGSQAASAQAPKPVFQAGSQSAQDWGPDRPLVIQLMIGRKVLEEVTVDRIGRRVARR